MTGLDEARKLAQGYLTIGQDEKLTLDQSR